MGKALTQAELEATHCWWDAADRVPGRPAMTEFRRMLRYHQAKWREANGHPIGSQPMLPKPGHTTTPVGSRIPLDYGRETGANFLSAAALDAARSRSSNKEPHQSFDHQRLWADLLSSLAMSLNLFGDLTADRQQADRAVHTWWPDTPGTLSEVLFAHSPGRFDLEYLGNLIDLDTAFILDLDDGRKGIVGVIVRYHERIKAEEPKQIRVWRYAEIAERSGIFRPGAIEALNRRSDLFEMWLWHLLILSMLQHPGGEWGWGRLVIVHPADSPDFVDGCARYRDLLVDQSTFSTSTLEEILGSGALPQRRTAVLRRRYIAS